MEEFKNKFCRFPPVCLYNMLPCQARPRPVSAHPLPSRASGIRASTSSSQSFALSQGSARAPRQHTLFVYVEGIRAMRFSRRSPLLSLGLGVALLVMAVSAAGKKSTDSSLSNSQPSTNIDAQTTASPAPSTGQSSSSNPPQTSSPPASSSPSSQGSQTTSSPNTASQSSQSTSSQGVTITGPSGSSSNTGSVPALPSSNTATDFPTLAGAYVAPSVPPTANAPFMQQSKLPEGTVFIIVGAILGFLAMSVILWRGLVVWSLHRSIKRAAVQQNVSTAKSTFQTPPAPFYAFKDRESTLSVSGMGPKSGRKGGPRPSTASALSNQSLFFSPTAGANGLGNPVNRGSGYLPAGYYAAGASQLGNGQGMAHVGSGNPGISLSNLGPSRDGYAKTRSVGPSPPGSPYINAIPSSSTLNLSQAPGDQRAPSTYLDDLFDSEGSPPVPNHRRNPSGAARGSARF